MPKTTRSTTSQPSHPSNLLRYDPSKPKRSDSPPPTFTKGSSQEFEENEPLTLIEDLEENLDRYKAPMSDSSTLTLFSWSSTFRLNIDRVQERIKPKPSRNAVVSACIYRGLVTIRKDERAKMFMDIRSRYKLIPSNVDTSINSIVSLLVNPSSIELPSGTRTNIQLPRNILGMLSDLSDDMGLSSSSLAALTIMDELSDCRDITLDEDRVRLQALVKLFYRNIRTRGRAAEVILEDYGL